MNCCDEFHSRSTVLPMKAFERAFLQRFEHCGFGTLAARYLSSSDGTNSVDPGVGISRILQFFRFRKFKHLFWRYPSTKSSPRTVFVEHNLFDSSHRVGHDCVQPWVKSTAVEYWRYNASVKKNISKFASSEFSSVYRLTDAGNEEGLGSEGFGCERPVENF